MGLEKLPPCKFTVEKDLGQSGGFFCFFLIVSAVCQICADRLVPANLWDCLHQRTGHPLRHGHHSEDSRSLSTAQCPVRHVRLVPLSSHKKINFANVQIYSFHHPPIPAD